MSPSKSRTARPEHSPLRVLLAKLGLDGHDRGIRIIARILRDAGHEVLYLGRRQSAQAVISAAIQEEVDVVGISTLSGTHMPMLREFMLEGQRAGIDVPVVVGGTILRGEIAALEAIGIRAVFPVGTPLEDIRDYFAKLSESINSAVTRC